MAGKVKRLSKVAKELNVGISTIVEFLSGKGVEIDSNPNTKIDDDWKGYTEFFLNPCKELGFEIKDESQQHLQFFLKYKCNYY
jgi:hypothetical protein